MKPVYQPVPVDQIFARGGLFYLPGKFCELPREIKGSGQECTAADRIDVAEVTLAGDFYIDGLGIPDYNFCITCVSGRREG